MLVKRLRHGNCDSPARTNRACPWFGQQHRTNIPGLRDWAGLFCWHCMGKDLEAGIVRGLHRHFNPHSPSDRAAQCGSELILL